MPIEVAQFAYNKLLQNLHKLGSPKAQLRMAKSGKAGPVVTDNGNFVIDAPFDEAVFKEPKEVSDTRFSCSHTLSCVVESELYESSDRTVRYVHGAG